jgi:hypothetical protein
VPYGTPGLNKPALYGVMWGGDRYRPGNLIAEDPDPDDPKPYMVDEWINLG